MLKLLLSSLLSMSAVFNKNSPLDNNLSCGQSVRGLYPVGMLSLEQRVSHSNAPLLHNTISLTNSSIHAILFLISRLPSP